jgi:hypothetical protein
MRGQVDVAAAPAVASAAVPRRADGSPAAIADSRALAASWPVSWLSAAAVTATMLPVYLLGFGRNYGYDESVTVGNFIQTPSPLDALTRQIVNNNHPLLSFLDHLVFSATGNDSEVVMRLIPLVAALAAVAILTVSCARRFGAIAGLSAGAYLASNPTFALWAQSVRGYSLLTLCVIASSVLLLQRRDASWKGVAYVVAVAAGVATNVFMVPVVVCEAAYLAARRELSARWCLRMLAGVFVGVGIALLPVLLMAVDYRGSIFSPTFPITVFDLDFPGIAAAAFVPLVLLATYRHRRDHGVVAALLALLAMMAGLWLVIQPFDLYARLFCWTLPLIGVGIAAAVRAWKPASVVAMAGVAAVLLTQYAGFGAPEEANLQVAAVIDQAHVDGLRVCGLGDMNSFDAYTHEFSEATSLTELRACDVAVAVWLPWSKPDDHAIRQILPVETVYSATNPISVYRR